ncbi:hypothetical protein JVU11DRAFT_8251 [Chiua virens]|nr:hypothetical protein JVU11DRAFT_8251 [Chiua virens]
MLGEASAQGHVLFSNWHFFHFRVSHFHWILSWSMHEASDKQNRFNTLQTRSSQQVLLLPPFNPNTSSPASSLYSKMTSKNKQKKQGGRNHRGLTSKDTPLDEYFAKYYSEFEHDPVESAEREFIVYATLTKHLQGRTPQEEIRNLHVCGGHATGQRCHGPIQDFFSSYAPRFQYDLTASSSSEFLRLCDEFGWDKEHPERKRAHQEFNDALVLQFNKLYGTDVDDLKNWKSLCRVMRIKPVPDDLHTCRETVRGTFVNLVDVVDARTTGVKAKSFGTERQLSEYTLSTGKVFPKENAHAGGVLQHLLKPNFLPYYVSPMTPSYWGAIGRR